MTGHAQVDIEKIVKDSEDAEKSGEAEASETADSEIGK